MLAEQQFSNKIGWDTSESDQLDLSNQIRAIREAEGVGTEHLPQKVNIERKVQEKSRLQRERETESCPQNRGEGGHRG